MRMLIYRNTTEGVDTAAAIIPARMQYSNLSAIAEGPLFGFVSYKPNGKYYTGDSGPSTLVNSTFTTTLTPNTFTLLASGSQTSSGGIISAKGVIAPKTTYNTIAYLMYLPDGVQVTIGEDYMKYRFNDLGDTFLGDRPTRYMKLSNGTLSIYDGLSETSFAVKTTTKTINGTSRTVVPVFFLQQLEKADSYYQSETYYLRSTRGYIAVQRNSEDPSTGVALYDIFPLNVFEIDSGTEYIGFSNTLLAYDVDAIDLPEFIMDVNDSQCLKPFSLIQYNKDLIGFGYNAFEDKTNGVDVINVFFIKNLSTTKIATMTYNKTSRTLTVKDANNTTLLTKTDTSTASYVLPVPSYCQTVIGTSVYAGFKFAASPTYMYLVELVYNISTGSVTARKTSDITYNVSFIKGYSDDYVYVAGSQHYGSYRFSTSTLNINAFDTNERDVSAIHVLSYDRGSGNADAVLVVWQHPGTDTDTAIIFNRQTGTTIYPKISIPVESRPKPLNATFFYSPFGVTNLPPITPMAILDIGGTPYAILNGYRLNLTRLSYPEVVLIPEIPYMSDTIFQETADAVVCISSLVPWEELSYAKITVTNTGDVIKEGLFLDLAGNNAGTLVRENVIPVFGVITE